MNLSQLIAKRKGDLRKRGYVPGTSRVFWEGYEGTRRRFSVSISAGEDHILFISGTCRFDESGVGGTHSVLYQLNAKSNEQMTLFDNEED